MSDLKYSREHEWVRLDGDIATVGISQFAQEQLGDVVFVELPDLGKAVEQNGDAAVVESVKAASEVYASFDIVAATHHSCWWDPSHLLLRPITLAIATHHSCCCCDPSLLLLRPITLAAATLHSCCCDPSP